MKHGRSWLSALLISFSILSFAQKEPVDYVNTIIGASTSAEAGKSGHGLGKTFPGSCTPFGLVQLSPDTKTGGDNGPGYSWHHSTIFPERKKEIMSFQKKNKLKNDNEGIIQVIQYISSL